MGSDEIFFDKNEEEKIFLKTKLQKKPFPRPKKKTHKKVFISGNNDFENKEDGSRSVLKKKMRKNVLSKEGANKYSLLDLKRCGDSRKIFCKSTLIPDR